MEEESFEKFLEKVIIKTHERMPQEESFEKFLEEFINNGLRVSLNI